MDETDRLILTELEREGRLTVTELADRVGLTTAPCSRRLRDLERSGAIAGYRAVLDRAAVGLNFEALVQVTMALSDSATISAFETSLTEIPEIRHAERMFGDPDYLLRVVATDIEDFARVRDESIATLTGVGRVTSTIVMRTIVDNRPLPLFRNRSRNRPR